MTLRFLWGGAWTKLYADRYASVPIRMNAVLPGIILADDAGSPSEEIAEQVPLARAGNYDEVAEAVAFLLSEKSAYVTGQNIRVDGGLSRGI